VFHVVLHKALSFRAGLITLHSAPFGSADKAVADGYLLPADYQIAIQQAKSAPIPN
jgi:hypothetical protein